MNNQQFWEWFTENEKDFHQVVKRNESVDNDFIDKVLNKLNEIQEGYYLLTGMYDEHTAELIISAEGTVKHIVFVEELIAAAPKLEGWRFTALKPPLDIVDVNIEMDGYEFNRHTLGFYQNELPAYPDEIDITVAHKDYNEGNKNIIINGVYIFLDNFLGELNFVTGIDHLEVTGAANTPGKLIPIEKLKDYLTWREKEFIEKYKGKQHNTVKGTYSGMKATLNGLPVLATINTDILKWDGKASHPWILVIKMQYDGSGNNGLPSNEDHAIMDETEHRVMAALKVFDGYIHIGRQTTDNTRKVYFACNEFRRVSKILQSAQEDVREKFDLSYDIFKDKYWQTFNRFKR